ncbi:hypothetical protein AURDEDRAFT_143076 [Auricularia subglabra TFB-10046 SS5]|nr:hypothetical protein AURDEDRAFT_143076 [Auricularia subglabra TFB-10046 SS5]
MSRPVQERLRNQAVYVDIGVHSGKDGREARKQFKEKIKTMGAKLVDDAFDADIIVADPLHTASLDELATSFSGTIVMHHFITDCFRKDIPIDNYVMKFRPPSPIPPLVQRSRMRQYSTTIRTTRLK